ncbi:MULTISPECIES: hypothetical protein [Streptomycetaceae]|uniref:hypothetical protein n=1 Tax=Streptomycetaceae TaxID=2062 RepID=UPI000A937BED|nr:hypothetical protein [Streptomyces sp. CB02056]
MHLATRARRTLSRGATPAATYAHGSLRSGHHHDPTRWFTTETLTITHCRTRATHP